MRDARAFMVATMRHQVGFAAALVHARLRLSRLDLVGHSGRTAGRYASAATAFFLQQLLSRHVVPWAGAGAALALPEAVCSKTLARGGCDGLARLGRWPWPLK